MTRRGAAPKIRGSVRRLAILFGSVCLCSLASADPAPAEPQAKLVVKNDSNVDIALDFAVDGKGVPGCFWAMHGRSTSFALPPGKLRWAYAVTAMSFTGSFALEADSPKLFHCAAWTNKYGEDDASCELGSGPDSVPPEDGMDVLAEGVFGALEALRAAFDKKDAKALAALASFPMDVEWSGAKPGKKRIRKASDALRQKSAFALDETALAAAAAAKGGAKTGLDDCDKSQIDWTRGDAAFTCSGQDVTVALRTGAACGKFRHLDTWTLSNRHAKWSLFSKGIRQGVQP